MKIFDLTTHAATDLIGTNPPANDVDFSTDFPYLAAPHTDGGDDDDSAGDDDDDDDDDSAGDDDDSAE